MPMILQHQLNCNERFFSTAIVDRYIYSYSAWRLKKKKKTFQIVLFCNRFFGREFLYLITCGEIDTVLHVTGQN